MIGKNFILALQNHGPIIHGYKDVLNLIEKVGLSAFKACMDIQLEGKKAESAEWHRQRRSLINTFATLD